MPSFTHEVLVDLFRSPSLVVEVLSDVLGVDVPAHEWVVLSSGELTQAAPKELRADAVLMVHSVRGKPVLGVVVEVQLSEKEDKYWTWPSYLTSLRTRFRCPVVLLVVCPSRRVAAYYAKPIELGPGWVLRPLVLGPEQIAVVTDPELAAGHLELAVLSAIAHSTHPEHDRIMHALFSALDTVDRDRANRYTDLVLSALPDAVQAHLETIMTTGTEYRSDFARRYFSQGHAAGITEGIAEGEAKGLSAGRAEGLSAGRAEGEAKGLSAGRAEGEVRALLAILTARGIRVPEHARTRITACTDLDQLDRWVGRAVTATTIDDILD